MPVASAILTTIHPTKYTVIDFRALESLGVSKWDGSVSYYLSYLRACSELAFKHKVSLRTLIVRCGNGREKIAVKIGRAPKV